MLYRNLKTIDYDVSLLGLGCMRFPLKEDDKVDEEQSISMIRRAIDCGVNYVDTAYTYHGGLSEVLVGKAMKDGYRDRALIADKLPIWLVKEEADVRRLFDEQMERLDVDCIDMYLVHNIIPENWAKTKKYNTLAFLEKKKQEGRIAHPARAVFTVSETKQIRTDPS